MESQNGKNSLFKDLTAERQSGLTYSAAAVLPVIISFVFLLVVQLIGLTDAEGKYTSEEWYLYCNFLLPQLSFALVAFLFFRMTKAPVGTVAGKCRAKYFLLAILLQVGLFSLSFVNGLFLDFLGRFGYENSEITLPSLDGAGVIGVLLVVGLLPAVFEETIFRGIVLRGLKSFGAVGAVLICGALFSLYHENPAQTIYQFLCGAAFALVALRSGSILPTVLSHFLNNAVIVVLTKFGIESYPSAVAVPLMIVSALCLVGSLVWLIFFDGPKRSENPGPSGGTSDKKGFFLYAALGILVCAVMWLSVLATGFGN